MRCRPEKTPIGTSTALVMIGAVVQFANLLRVRNILALLVCVANGECSKHGATLHIAY